MPEGGSSRQGIWREKQRLLLSNCNVPLPPPALPTPSQTNRSLQRRSPQDWVMDQTGNCQKKVIVLIAPCHARREWDEIECQRRKLQSIMFLCCLQKEQMMIRKNWEKQIMLLSRTGRSWLPSQAPTSGQWVSCQVGANRVAISTSFYIFPSSCIPLTSWMNKTMCDLSGPLFSFLPNKKNKIS